MLKTIPARILLVAALLVAFAGMSSTAMASSIKEPIQEGNGFCGYNATELPVIGSTKYSRKKNVVKFTYKITKGVPNSAYEVELWGNTPSCHDIATVATTVTNSKGKATVKAAVPVSAEETNFFATAWGPNGWNDTPEVILP